jgi:hypothetical protein
VLAHGLDLAARWRVRPASLEASVWITNRWQDEVEVPAAWRLGADFADLQQALGGAKGFGARVAATDGGVDFT